MASVFNHVGHCVSDLGRARRFYEELLGFEFWREVRPPDDATAPLMRLPAPLGLAACYLRLDGFVLELLHYADAATLPPRTRPMNEPGLTHLSVCVDDLAATCARVPEYGGEVLADTDIGAAVMIRDPDGQLVELLPIAYRASLEAGT